MATQARAARRRKARAAKKNNGSEWNVRRWLQCIGKLVAAILVIIGLPSAVGFIVDALPNVQIEARGNPDASQPFSTAFLLSNTGRFPAHAIDVECVITELRMSNGTLIRGNRIAAIDGMHVSKLRAGDTVPVPNACSTVTDGPFVVGGDILIKAQYRYPWPWTSPHTTQARFFAQRQSDGSLIWLKHPDQPE